MRHTLLLLLLSLATLTLHAAMPGLGVSAELAQQRRAAIGSLAYDLRFTLPRERAENVEGEVTVRFTLTAPQDIALDFKAAPGAVKSVRVGGCATHYIYEDEHITLPAQCFRSGGEQRVTVRFTAGDQSLNRRDDLLYTLLVPDRARTLFPCFDQPDLKALYTLTLTLPTDWAAVSNTAIAREQVHGASKTVQFATTEPLSTYLFSFVAGHLNRNTFSDGHGRDISVYHREHDPQRVGQLPTIARQVFQALAWQERFTGIAYPFAKYDLIILPGFQFGGMEHTGATLYNDRRLFLSAHPTPDEELERATLIAHETSHMWFGDYTTMRWFDDVWTKEVFANYFAAAIASPRFPTLSPRLIAMRSYLVPALAQDLTPGTTAIRQELDNLQDAGLVYNNIIYDKSPLVMEKIVEVMGREAFREGIRRYLRGHAYGTATWDDLVLTLDSLTPRDLRAFSRAWVGSKSLPRIHAFATGDTLRVEQHDPLSRSLTWLQTFDVQVFGKTRDTTVTVTFGDGDSTVTVPIGFRPAHIVASSDGRAYGEIVPDSASEAWLLRHWHTLPKAETRLAAAMTLHGRYLATHFADTLWLRSLLGGLSAERDALAASYLTGCLATPMRQCPAAADAALWHISRSHPLAPVRTEALRTLAVVATDRTVVDSLYALWQTQSEPLLSESDYTTLAYELSLRRPKLRPDILSRQRQRLTNDDRRRQFDFVSRFTTSDTLAADTLFAELLLPESRRIEPWALAALRYLTHPLRGPRAARYIRPTLDALPDVQRTGDIFMPANWCATLLSRQTTPEAAAQIRRFLAEHSDMKPLLRGKILQALPPFFTP